MKSNADICRENRWTVGTILEGDEGYGPERIIITAIGEQNILARAVFPKRLHEASWTLEFRDWTMAEAKDWDVYEAQLRDNGCETVYLAMDRKVYFAPGDGGWEQSMYPAEAYKPIRYIGRWKRGGNA